MTHSHSSAGVLDRAQLLLARTGRIVAQPLAVPAVTELAQALEVADRDVLQVVTIARRQPQAAQCAADKEHIR